MKRITIGLMALTSLTTSCSYHFGMVGGGSGVVTNNDFQTIDYAFGTSKTVNILGIGGNNKDALLMEAKRNLLLNRPLKAGEVVGQTTVDFKRTLFFPVMVNKVIVSSEIIDFSASQIDSLAFYKDQENFVGIVQEAEYTSGEMVAYGNQSIARVLGRKKDKYIIKYFDENNNLKIKRVNKKFLRPINNGSIVVVGPSVLRSLRTSPKSSDEKIRFIYKGEVIEGDLIEKNEDTYFILVENEQGKRVGIYVSKKDIVDQ